MIATLRAILLRQHHRSNNSLGIGTLREQVIEAKMLSARVLINQMKLRGIVSSIHEAEFKVFSQFGDDGIIQYLVHSVGIPEDQRVFVEFGVENYEEANTRFLLMNDNWRGLVMDGSPENMSHARTSPYYWKCDLTAVAAFINRENINDLLHDQGFSGKIGLLSIDIDGNDYWVWERIEVVDPIVVIVEYNSVFGVEHAVTIPYDPDFRRTHAHYSNLYWGCSHRALCLLAERKGYVFVGCTSVGNNAYFIRRDKLGALKGLSAEQGYVMSRFRESRDISGQLNYLTGKERLQEISGLNVYDLVQDRITTIAKLFKIT